MWSESFEFSWALGSQILQFYRVGLAFVVQPSRRWFYVKKMRKEFGITFFYLSAQFSRRSTLKFEFIFEFLRNELPSLLKDVPLATVRSMIFQHDGAPPTLHEGGWKFFKSNRIRVGSVAIGKVSALNSFFYAYQRTSL